MALSSCLGTATQLPVSRLWLYGENALPTLVLMVHSEEGGSHHGSCAGLNREEMWMTTLACSYCRAHCREIISTSSSPASWSLQQSALLQSCSWAAQCSLQGAILQEQGRLKHGCQTCVDVPEVAGMVESQHVAVNLGWGVGWRIFSSG